MREPDAGLVTGNIGRFRAEEHEVERGAIGPDRLEECCGRRLRVGLAAVGDREDRPIGTDCQLLAQLLLGLGGAQREQRDAAPVGIAQLDSSLDRALLMRAQGEPEPAGVDLARIIGEDERAAHEGYALDADEDLHQAMILVFVGSKRPAVVLLPTVHGYCSPRYSTSSFVPTAECSGGR
ncbi:unannotated protein [freshwater metagenome]|uniref:Unannotated protein n=1 Tax=freshwater metagenome TaxID=449393 RepID=A0A6J7Q9J7_9ZZZZ